MNTKENGEILKFKKKKEKVSNFTNLSWTEAKKNHTKSLEMKILSTE